MIVFQNVKTQPKKKKLRIASKEWRRLKLFFSTGDRSGARLPDSAARGKKQNATQRTRTGSRLGLNGPVDKRELQNHFDV
jgi:hypothetical protein